MRLHCPGTIHYSANLRFRERPFGRCCHHRQGHRAARQYRAGTEHNGNESGYFAVSSIPIGDFEIIVEAAGFKTFTQKNVKVDVNAKANVDVTLEVGSVNESVVANSDAAQVETSNGDVGRLITGQQATNMQLNGRNFTQLLALIPECPPPTARRWTCSAATAPT